MTGESIVESIDMVAPVFFALLLVLLAMGMDWLVRFVHDARQRAERRREMELIPNHELPISQPLGGKPSMPHRSGSRMIRATFLFWGGPDMMKGR